MKNTKLFFASTFSREVQPQGSATKTNKSPMCSSSWRLERSHWHWELSKTEEELRRWFWIGSSENAKAWKKSWIKDKPSKKQKLCPSGKQKDTTYKTQVNIDKSWRTFLEKRGKNRSSSPGGSQQWGGGKRMAMGDCFRLINSCSSHRCWNRLWLKVVIIVL